MVHLQVRAVNDVHTSKAHASNEIIVLLLKKIPSVVATAQISCTIIRLIGSLISIFREEAQIFILFRECLHCASLISNENFIELVSTQNSKFYPFMKHPVRIFVVDCRWKGASRAWPENGMSSNLEKLIA